MPVNKKTSTKTGVPKEAPKTDTKPKINTLIGFEQFVSQTEEKVKSKLAELTRTGRDTDPHLLQLATDKIINKQVRESKWV
jgi:hypothetical protein